MRRDPGRLDKATSTCLAVECNSAHAERGKVLKRYSKQVAIIGVIGITLYFFIESMTRKGEILYPTTQNPMVIDFGEHFNAGVYAKNLVSGDQHVRAKAMHDLQQFTAATRAPLIQPLIAEMKPLTDVHRISPGIWALGLVGPEASDEIQVNTVIPFLIEFLKKKDSIMRDDSHAARRALGNFRRNAVPQLIPLLRLSEVNEIAIGLLESRVDFDDPKAVSNLIRLLDDENIDVRTGASRALRRLKPSQKKYVSKLIEVFNNPVNRPLRNHVALIFHSLGPAAIEAAPEVINCAQDKDDAPLRQVCVSVLGEFGLDYPDSIPHLVHALYDPSCLVKTTASEALQKIGTKEALSAVEHYEASDRYCELVDI
jgi:HEAT repeat protein